jgi:hypothetical protein
LWRVTVLRKRHHFVAALLFCFGLLPVSSLEGLALADLATHGFCTPRTNGGAHPLGLCHFFSGSARALEGADLFQTLVPRLSLTQHSVICAPQLTLPRTSTHSYSVKTRHATPRLAQSSARQNPVKGLALCTWHDLTHHPRPAARSLCPPELRAAMLVVDQPQSTSVVRRTLDLWAPSLQPSLAR